MSPSTSTVEHKPPRFYASKDALCPDLFNCAKLDALALSHCPNYWIPREVLEIGDNDPSIADQTQLLTSFEAVVAAVAPFAKRHLSDNTEDWSGAEVWCQIYENGRGLGMHFDKDEAIVLEEGRVVTPILSSVLFLTGTARTSYDDREEQKSNSDHHQQRQSPLILTNQAFNSTLNAPIPDDPTHTTLIFPVPNTYILFGGDLGHGVLDGADDAPERATLLINWWKERPKSIHRITVDEVIDRKLLLMLDTSNMALEKYNKSWDELARRSGTRMVEKMMGGGKDVEKGEEKEDGISTCQLNVSLDETTPQDDGDGEGEEELTLVTVDELIEEAGVTLVLGKDIGDDGHSKHELVDGCIISHPGFAMLPIESPGLQVLAGFVPLSQLE
jgi:hypothetical protein